eukprot:m.292465 g.292465  ORF g.292465 m.292465 type:complete len:262 (+) comp12633_c0_seq1:1572-2357(+)
MAFLGGSYHVWSATHNYYGCFMPKVGCSSWLHYLRVMQLPETLVRQDAQNFYRAVSHDEYGLHFRNWLDKSSAEHIKAERIINNPRVFKWAIVRHPWQRLVSGFRSKYEGSCNFSRECLAQKWKVPVSRRGGVVTFHEFVRALSTVPPQHLDGHFRPAFMLCELNRIPYDFIAELNNKDDTDYISQRIGFPQSFADVERSAYSQQSYYGGRTHSVHNCTVTTVALAERIYATDAATLGFSFEDAYYSCLHHGTTSLPSTST